MRLFDSSCVRSGFTLVELTIVLLILASVAGLVLSMTAGTTEEARVQATLVSLQRTRDVASSRYYADVADWPQSMADLLRCRNSPPPITRLPPSAPSSSGPGWRGPYLASTGALYSVNPSMGFRPEYGPLHGSPAHLDGWGRPLVLQVPNTVLVETPPMSGVWILRSRVEQPPGSGIYVEQALRPLDLEHLRLVSAGPNGKLETPLGDEDVAGPALPGEPKSWFPPKNQCGDDLVLYVRKTDRRP